ncbi:histidinol-phosphate transaminase [Herbiconiux sp. KACC 21604]|uniref:histidinol-phosphate transaminase n=1 Tax=unclassified Herbiconiux TaxID=2618217 RepID=UPI0014909560|nr:histidinol-phosphate transaminase [Herbiconiux sp. SALV-R1]QJU55442.1 histidinol-phosphate transaminase [Herbiconiux sp. SALV-R1]WPO86624.1 histidinol-phosphate transaminase [Herbiconiux sp. KACC 21604]
MSSGTASSPVKLRPEILALPAYRQGQAAPSGFKLSSNENPFDPLPGVLEAVDAATRTLHRYPNAAAPEVTARIAAEWGVEPDEVILAAGSVALLVQLTLAAAGPGDEVVYSWRSFEVYPWMTVLPSAVKVAVPNTPDHRHDLDAMAAAITERTRLVLVCTPNNPTSAIVTAAEFESFMQKVPADVLVILDEAYAEFVTDPTAVNGRTLVRRYPNLVILRTFSKAYGLAGLRIGYGIGPAEVFAAARIAAMPLSLTDHAQVAAIASLDRGDELRARVADIAARRDAIYDFLVEQGWTTIPRPHGNFVWYPTGEHTERALGIFRDHGIIARAYLPDGVRLTIGEEESVENVLAASAQIMREIA